MLREDPIPWKRNRKCSRRMEDSTNLQISQTRVLTDHSVEGQSWEDLWGLSFDLCSPSRGTANVLRPSSPSKLMRDSGRLSNQEQWEVAYRYFPGFSFSSAVESCKTTSHATVSVGGTVYRPGRADRLSCQSPSCLTMSQNMVLLVPVVTWAVDIGL